MSRWRKELVFDLSSEVSIDRFCRITGVNGPQLLGVADERERSAKND